MPRRYRRPPRRRSLRPLPRAAPRGRRVTTGDPSPAGQACWASNSCSSNRRRYHSAARNTATAPSTPEPVPPAGRACLLATHEITNPTAASTARTIATPSSVRPGRAILRTPGHRPALHQRQHAVILGIRAGVQPGLRQHPLVAAHRRRRLAVAVVRHRERLVAVLTGVRALDRGPVSRSPRSLNPPGAAPAGEGPGSGPRRFRDPHG